MNPYGIEDRYGDIEIIKEDRLERFLKKNNCVDSFEEVLDIYKRIFPFNSCIIELYTKYRYNNEFLNDFPITPSHVIVIIVDSKYISFDRYVNNVNEFNQVALKLVEQESILGLLRFEYKK